jgi:hypothetical protein
VVGNSRRLQQDVGSPWLALLLTFLLTFLSLLTFAVDLP